MPFWPLFFVFLVEFSRILHFWPPGHSPRKDPAPAGGTSGSPTQSSTWARIPGSEKADLRPGETDPAAGSRLTLGRPRIGPGSSQDPAIQIRSRSGSVAGRFGQRVGLGFMAVYYPASPSDELRMRAAGGQKVQLDSIYFATGQSFPSLYQRHHDATPLRGPPCPDAARPLHQSGEPTREGGTGCE